VPRASAASDGGPGLSPVTDPGLKEGANSKNRDEPIYFNVRVRGQLRRVGVVIGVEMKACAGIAGVLISEQAGYQILLVLFLLYHD
jgi:hypothetical protein